VLLVSQIRVVVVQEEVETRTRCKQFRRCVAVSDREYVGLFRTIVVGTLVVMGVTAAWIVAWGLQTALVELVARSLGATSIEARGWGYLASVPAVLELVGILCVAGWAEERTVSVGLVIQQRHADVSTRRPSLRDHVVPAA
jgi:hypothetical protein